MEEQDIKKISAEDCTVLRYLQEAIDSLRTLLNHEVSKQTQYLTECALRLGIDNANLGNWRYDSDENQFKRIDSGANVTSA